MFVEKLLGALQKLPSFSQQKMPEFLHAKHLKIQHPVN